jgi:hypothetical protein
MRAARFAIAIAAAGLVAAAPSAASAAAPGVTTGGAAQVTTQTATLTGQVDPNGQSTTYYFQYGTTVSYGARSATTGAGSGTIARAAAGQIAGLAPNTRYHYRLLARNAAGTRAGADRTFLTARQPLGLVLTPSVNPVRYGGGTTLLGNLSGTGNASRDVRLQQNTFPFAGPWANVGNVQVTDRVGNFAFPLLSVPQTTQYRIIALGTAGSVVSPVTTVTVTVAIRTDVTRTVVRRGRKVRFFGIVRPAGVTIPVGIQKLGRKGRWVTIAGTVTRKGGTTFSRYGKTIRLRRGGTFRVYIGAGGGAIAPTFGREVKIRSFR